MLFDGDLNRHRTREGIVQEELCAHGVSFFCDLHTMLRAALDVADIRCLTGSGNFFLRTTGNQKNIGAGFADLFDGCDCAGHGLAENDCLAVGIGSKHHRIVDRGLNFRDGVRIGLNDDLVRAVLFLDLGRQTELLFAGRDRGRHDADLRAGVRKGLRKRFGRLLGFSSFFGCFFRSGCLFR